MFELIKENIEKMKDTSKVLCVRPHKHEGKMALFATIKSGEGRYKIVQLTEFMSCKNFPKEPLFHFYKEGGKTLLNDFLNLDNVYAFNKEHFAGFEFLIDPDKANTCIIRSKFKSGFVLAMSTHKIDKSFLKEVERLNKFMVDNGINPETTGDSITEDEME